MILEKSLVAPSVMTSSAASEFTGSKVGDTIRVRRPAFFGVDEFNSDSPGTAIKIQDAVETSVDLKIEKNYDVSFEISSKELTLSVDDFNERLLTPAMSALAQRIDTYALSKLAHLGGMAETADFTAPDSVADLSAIVQKLNEQKVPQANRKMIVSPSMQTQIYSIPNFVQANFRGDGNSPLQEAQLGRFMGMDMMMALDLPSHTAGALLQNDGDDVFAINKSGGYTEGTSAITLDGGPGSGTQAVAVGDTIRLTYVDGVARDHRVTAAQNIASGALTNLAIAPALYGIDPGTGTSAVDGGQPVVVDDNAVATLIGGSSTITSYTLGAAFVPEAFQLIFIPQPAPMGPGTSSATVSYKGMSLRVLQSFDHEKKRDLISVDVMLGCAALDPRLGVRVPAV
tara:strand:+ start:921 stop:2117 length:1197 start_codon:yes stop_codon:yes gene_type:complete